MNGEQNYVAFLSLLILCFSFGPKISGAKSNDKIDEIIVTEPGGNVTLLCNPSFRENSTLSSLASDIEWVTDNNVTIFSNGKLSPFLFQDHVDNSSFAIDANPPGTLILRKIFLRNSTFTCTFSTPETKITYSYFLQIKGKYRTSTIQISNSIALKNRGNRVSLDCEDKDIVKLPADFSYVWLSRKFRPNTATGEDDEDIEIISLNRTILLKDNNKSFQVANNRSLIIPNLSPVWKTNYECHTSDSYIFTYYTTWNENNRSESRDWTVTNMKKQSFSVDYGTKNVILPCPSINKNPNSSYTWVLSRAGFDVSAPKLLFLNQKKFEFDPHPYTDFCEINEDGSLVILVVQLPQYGTYTCQRSTGEQYVYKLNREINWINETVSIKSDSSNITLPCPVKDPRDRDYNLISWIIQSRSTQFNGEFHFVDGKMITSQNELPDNIKLAKDKSSLIVSNLKSTNSINDVYYCHLLYSGTIYMYTLAN